MYVCSLNEVNHLVWEFSPQNTTDYLRKKKKLVSDGKHPFVLLIRLSRRLPATQFIAVVLDCLPEVYGKTLLLKIPHIWDPGLRRFQMALTCKPPFYQSTKRYHASCQARETCKLQWPAWQVIPARQWWNSCLGAVGTSSASSL